MSDHDVEGLADALCQSGDAVEPSSTGLPHRRTVLAGAAAAALSSQLWATKREPASESEKGRRPQPPLVGVNIPWFNGWYGHDLGRNQAYSQFPACDIAQIGPGILGSAARFGVQVVRIGLFEDAEGLRYDDNGELLGLDSTFVSNLDALAGILRDLDMKAYWILVDADSVRRGRDYMTRSILLDSGVARRFVDVALEPVLPGLADVTWGVDLCNEPESIVSGAGGNRTGLGVNWWSIQPSLSVLRDAVRRTLPQAAVSVSSSSTKPPHQVHQHYTRLGLGLDFVDFHRPDRVFYGGGSTGGTGGSGGLSAGVGASPAGSIRGELTKRPKDKEFGGGSTGGGTSAMTARGDDGRKGAWIASQQAKLGDLRSSLSSGSSAMFLWRLPSEVARDPESLVFASEPGLVLHSLRAFEQQGLIRLRA